MLDHLKFGFNGVKELGDFWEHPINGNSLFSSEGIKVDTLSHGHVTKLFFGNVCFRNLEVCSKKTECVFVSNSIDKTNFLTI